MNDAKYYSLNEEMSCPQGLGRDMYVSKGPEIQPATSPGAYSVGTPQKSSVMQQ